MIDPQYWLIWFADVVDIHSFALGSNEVTRSKQGTLEG